MAYDIKAKFMENSPLPCWKGYERVPGTAKGAKGSCRKSSPSKHGSLKDFQRGKKGHNPDTMSAKHEDFHLKQSGDSPSKAKQKGGGTTKVCLPKAKIASMSSSEKQKVIRAKRAAGKAGKYRRSSKSNVTGTKSDGLRDWVKQDWRQVANPSKKCGEK